jgi:hypothetical protein
MHSPRAETTLCTSLWLRPFQVYLFLGPVLLLFWRLIVCVRLDLPDHGRLVAQGVTHGFVICACAFLAAANFYFCSGRRHLVVENLLLAAIAALLLYPAALFLG